MSPERRKSAHGLPDALQLTEPRRSFGLVLGAIVAAMVFQLAAPNTDLSRFVAIVLQSTVIVLALRAAAEGSRDRIPETAWSTPRAQRRARPARRKGAGLRPLRD